MDENNQAPQDDTQDDQGLLDKVKDAIPGDMDDKVIDAAGDVAGKVGDMASTASQKLSDAADTVTDKIPGEMDDKLVDGARNMMDKASDLAGKVTGGDDDQSADDGAGDENAA